MAKNTSSFKHESLQDKVSVLAYLNLIAQGIEKGQIHLANEDEDVTLNTNGLSRLKIKAKQAKSHQEIRITLAWSGESDPQTNQPPKSEVSTKSAKPLKKSDKPKKTKKQKSDKKTKKALKSKPEKALTKKASKKTK
ncbi:amphi-Trp domain-containing protein [Thiomicrospira sp.]|uniref:amphi-Trp domain-containing protein n=1 Tax=Thiomicrospira sp. TaxID=935 RepID=UPI002F9292D5